MKKILYLVPILLISGLAFSEEASVLKELYDLNVPDSEFVQIKLKPAEGIRLPLTEYPKLGKRLAFQLNPVTGSPVKIVIQTELPSDKFVKEVTQRAPQLNKHTKWHNIAENVQRHRRNRQGLHAIYSAVPTPLGIRYKLYQLSVPGKDKQGKIDDDAVIVATPIGNLQIFEKSEEPGKHAVTEINTSGSAAK